MMIESVRAFLVGFPPMGATCWVEIVTSDGISGIGQSGGWGHPRAVSEIIERLEPLLVGQDPRRIEHLWSGMNRALPFRGNLLSSAIAAIDTALWDIKGKSLSVPVWQLLGGLSRDRVRLHCIVRGTTPDTIGEVAKDAAGHGFTAVKFDPLAHSDDTRSIPQQISAMRDMAAAGRAAVGDDIDLIFDLHRKLDPATAPAFLEALDEFSPLYIEDPLQIDSIDTQADLGARSTSPLAVGERLSSIWEFRQLLQRGIPLVLRPDVGLAGGITYVRKIAALAESFHCTISPHNFLGPGITAATLHLATSIPNLLTMEYQLYDEDPASGAVITSAVREGGYLLPPEAPGLGISIHPDHGTIAPVTAKPLGWAGLLAGDGSVDNSI
ncbi:mandelate racemase/muconate lactonizing enzyme family protein [soil metagenome]